MNESFRTFRIEKRNRLIGFSLIRTSFKNKQTNKQTNQQTNKQTNNRPLTKQMAANNSRTSALVRRLLWLRLSAMHVIASLCLMTKLNPYLLFMIALRHMIDTWISSFDSPIFNFWTCFEARFIRGELSSILPSFSNRDTGAGWTPFKPPPPPPPPSLVSSLIVAGQSLVAWSLSMNFFWISSCFIINSRKLR